MESKTIRTVCFGILLTFCSRADAAMIDCRNPVEIELSSDVAMRFCEIPAGRAVIGSNEGEENERPAMERQFKTFQMGQFEVTQAEYMAVMGEEPWRGRQVKTGANYPAAYVDFEAANEFSKRLNQLDPAATYRLPTEAEWEYAARGGTTTSYYWGDSFDPSYARFSRSGPLDWAEPVDSCPKKSDEEGYCANGFGLMHMIGNVWEWTQDVYLPDYKGASEDGHVAVKDKGSYRVIRGGAYWDNAWVLRVTARGFQSDGFSSLGFRLVRVPRFHVNALDSSFKALADRVYSSKGRFFTAAAEIAASLPNDFGDWNYERMQGFAGRLFLMNAVAPVVFGTDSRHFIEKVHDIYRVELDRVNEENAIASLTDISPNPIVLKVAVRMLVAAVQECRATVPREADRQSLERILRTAGQVLAGSLKNRHDVEALLNELRSSQSLIDALIANHRTSELGQVAQSIAEYLNGI